MTQIATGIIERASVILREHGYEALTISIMPEKSMLLAENDFFALGVIEFEDVTDLSRVEASAAAELSGRLKDSSGVKRWDAYLVLLSPNRQDDASPLSESVASIVYNTQFFRRIVRWGTSANDQSLFRALRAFLPLTVTTAGPVVSPAERLAGSLPSFGISADEAAAALVRWRESNSDDAP